MPAPKYMTLDIRPQLGPLVTLLPAAQPLAQIIMTLQSFMRTTLIPLFLMIVSPPAVQFVWVVCVHHSGYVSNVFDSSLATLWSQFPTATLHAAEIALVFLFSQYVLLLALPGKTFTAIPTPMGNRPQYRLNGIAAFVLTHVALAAAAYLRIVRYAELYDVFGSLLAVLGKSALVCTLLLYVRGIYFPTNSDSGVTGNGFVWDLWHGTELHPEMFGVSLKQLINCRFAMMGWSVAVIAFACKQYELYGYLSNSMLVSTILQMVYILKFFVWEGGYFNSVDIIHDRFGFYIFWGCSAFLPSIYTLTSFYLTTHAIDTPPAIAATIVSVGLAAVWANYDTDRQRQHFRATNGKEKVWGRAARVIEAVYVTGDGKKRTSLLLASGWWGVARHMNYVFEISLALCWSVPAASSALIPYVYVIFLTILLTDRAYRDELRCSDKYGKYYDEYCKLVRWRMLPGIY